MIWFLLLAAIGAGLIAYGDRQDWYLGSRLVLGGAVVFLVGIIGALVAL